MQWSYGHTPTFSLEHKDSFAMAIKRRHLFSSSTWGFSGGTYAWAGVGIVVSQALILSPTRMGSVLSILRCQLAERSFRIFHNIASWWYVIRYITITNPNMSRYFIYNLPHCPNFKKSIAWLNVSGSTIADLTVCASRCSMRWRRSLSVCNTAWYWCDDAPHVFNVLLRFVDIFFIR